MFHCLVEGEFVGELAESFFGVIVLLVLDDDFPAFRQRDHSRLALDASVPRAKPVGSVLDAVVPEIGEAVQNELGPLESFVEGHVGRLELYP